MELLIGILCGIALSLFFSFGPAFFGLIQSSIQHGFKRAVSFVIGVSLSDIVVVFLMLTVLKNLDMVATMHNIYVASIGGVGIIIMGIYTFHKKAMAPKDKKSRLRFRDDEDTRTWHLVLHGFLLNILNPFIWIYWISVITVLSAEVQLQPTERYIFFAGLLLATTGCDILKCRLASLLQMWFTVRRLNFFNKVTGVILMIFGVYMIASMVVYQTSPKAREREQDHAPQSTRIIQTLHNHIVKDSSKRADTLYLQ